MDVYLEIGQKRTFAGALDWPGWCRSGKDEAGALQALFDYGLRYQLAIHSSGVDFQPPPVSALQVVERWDGNAGTDFGAPSVSPSVDAEPVGTQDLERFQALLQAMWRAFDAAVLAAQGKELRKGPRGGGRDLQRIIQHVVESQAAYLTQLGWKVQRQNYQVDLPAGFDPYRQDTLTALGAASRGELPTVGPRGGLRWKPRFFVRYFAWHLLDHLWEIEDRII